MRTLDYFKLPLTMVALFVIFNGLINVFFVIISSNSQASFSFEIISFINYSLIFPNFYRLPLLLLLFFVTTVACYRINVFEVNANNCIIGGVIVFIAALLIAIISYVSMHAVLIPFMTGTYHYYAYDWFMFWYSLVSTSINLIILMLVVGVLMPMFKQNFTSTAPELAQLNPTSSKSLHLILFIVLFLALTLVVPFSLKNYIFRDFLDYSYHFGIVILVFTIGLMIFTAIIYLCIRHSFSGLATTIELAKLVKSSLISFFSILILNGICGFAMFIIVLILAFSSRRSDEGLIIMALFIVPIILFIINAIILRFITKRYFYNYAITTMYRPIQPSN